METVTNVEASPDKEVDCQRFFGQGKRIPKGKNHNDQKLFYSDVKRHCGMCRQHGIIVETRGHLCPYKNCDCWKVQRFFSTVFLV